VALIEGVMGLFDGASATSEEGSTAQIAKWLDAPVLLVCDASGMARSVAALAHGYATFDEQLRVAGVICNRVGSPGHLGLLREALAPAFGYVAGLPRQKELAFPERHLGLRTAERDAVAEECFDGWARLAEAWLDLDALLMLAGTARPLLPHAQRPSTQPRAHRCRIGVAHDEAFHFYYAYNLRALEQAGAELVRFSPLHDGALPELDGLYLGGGYPELHAQALSHNVGMRQAVRAFAAQQKPIYAECGGLMYLARSIRTLAGESHPMVGLVPGEAVMAERLCAIGYVDVETTRDTTLGPAGTRYRGHQFRYSELVQKGDIAQAFVLSRRRGSETFCEGYLTGNTLASYVHAHWASNPQVPEAFVAACSLARRA
jgi:cobyrinic acid a,c-diamide synthase